MCEGFIILGASDRMVTSGDVEFEPPRPKIFPLSNSIVAMTAGDSALQTEILFKVAEDVAEGIRVAPTVWVPIRDVAEMYSLI